MQVKRNRLTQVVFILCLCLGTNSTPVVAQIYEFERGSNNVFSKPHEIISPTKAHFVYGNLSKGAEIVDYYRVTFDGYTQNVPFTLLVPEESELKGFRPSLIISDGGSPRMIGTVPYGFPEIGGRVYSWPDGASQTTRDDKTFSRFFVGPTVSRDVDVGSLLVAVYNPAGTSGRYVLKIGSQLPKEDWKNSLNFLWTLLRIKLRLY